MTLPESPSDALYRAVIGQRNQNYYLSYFRRADGRGYAPIAWHWPVLFLGLLWLVYRKQYRLALIAFAFPSIATILATAVNTVLPGSHDPLFYLMFGAFSAVWLPLKANALYYHWARREVDVARAMLPNQPALQEAHLQKRGGTNDQLPLIVLAAFLLMSLLAGSLAPATSA